MTFDPAIAQAFNVNRGTHAGTDLIDYAHARIDHWIGRTREVTPGGYPAAVALLRATYDLIDRLKVWEEERGLDGAALFRQVCAELDAAHGDALPVRAGERRAATPPAEAAASTEAILRANLRDLRAQHEVQQGKLAQELVGARAALRAIENSTFWRATAWPRRVAGRLRS